MVKFTPQSHTSPTSSTVGAAAAADIMHTLGGSDVSQLFDVRTVFGPLPRTPEERRTFSANIIQEAWNLIEQVEAELCGDLFEEEGALEIELKEADDDAECEINAELKRFFTR